MNTSKINWSEFFNFKGSYPLLGALGICLLFSAALGAFVPQYVGDLSRYYGKSDSFYISFKVLLCIFLGIYINRSFYQLLINKYVKLLVQNVRTLCYSKWLLNYDLQTEKENGEDKYPQGEVLARIINDTESLRDLITSGTFGIFIDLFFVISCLISFVTINPVTGWTLTLSEVGAAILLVWGSKYMRSVFLNVRHARGNVSKTVANLVGGVGETYYIDHGNYARKKGESVFDDFLKKQLKANIWDSSYYSVAESLYPLLLALVVFIFPYSNITDVAVIFIIVDLIQRSIGPVKDISSKIANVQRAASGMIRMSEFLTDIGSSFSSPDASSKVKVDFNHLSVDIENFEYPKRNEDEKPFSLSNIKFTADKGNLVGIVGLSGCGKSTVLNILSGNIVPNNAEVTLTSSTGKKISFPGDGELDLISYREQVGIVSQDSHVFSESVAFNITLQRETPSDFQEFWDWIESRIPYLKHWGISATSLLDQKTLSLGQKQLLAAIRSCYLKKTIVLFDEVSSGLDSDLELALRRVVLLIQENSLTFIVAHRIETIIQADKIIVMEEGRIIDEGKHDSLITSSKVYKEFIEELSQSH